MPRGKKPLAKKRKFVKDGIFYAELNDFLSKELAESGYAGCEVRVTPQSTEVIIRATKTSGVVGEKGQKIRELTALITKRFKFKPGSLQLVAEKVKNRGLSSLAQAEAVRYRLFEGLSVRRACYSVLKFIKERGAKGCEVIISGKLRGQRAKSMKFREGYMLHAGDAVNYYIDEAVKHLHLKQGVLGIKVKIMLPYDPTGKGGIPRELPDVVIIRDPKETEALQDAIGQIQQAEEPRGKAAILQEVVNESMRQDIRDTSGHQEQPSEPSAGGAYRSGGGFRGGGGAGGGGFRGGRGGFRGNRDFRSDRGSYRGRGGGYGGDRGGYGGDRGSYGGDRSSGQHNYQYDQSQGGGNPLPPDQQYQSGGGDYGYAYQQSGHGYQQSGHGDTGFPNYQ